MLPDIVAHFHLFMKSCLCGFRVLDLLVIHMVQIDCISALFPHASLYVVVAVSTS